MTLDMTSILERRLRHNEKLISVLLHNIPENWTHLRFVERSIKTLELSVYSTAFIPTAALAFNNSCHLCEVNNKDIFENNAYCVILTIANIEFGDLWSRIQTLNKDISVRLICKAKANRDLTCPLLIEQQRKQKALRDNLLQLLENWFSDSEIFDMKDILISMNKYGWVPIDALMTKLENILISVENDLLLNHIRKSSLLQLDKSERFVRRILPLPESEAHKKVLLTALPNEIKNIRQMQSFLDMEGSSVEYFDYQTHSSLVSFYSREEAERVVKRINEKLLIKARSLVPTISTDPVDQNVNIGDDETTISDMSTIIRKLMLSSGPSIEFHVTRLTPEELSYSFHDGFVPPTPNVVDKIVRQCNFYFGDENILKDLFLLKKVKSSPEGWVDMRMIASFKMLRKLSNDDIDTVVYAMCSSDQVQISRDGLQLRRRLPLPDWDPSVYVRSLFLWHLPSFCDSYTVLYDVFKQEGRFSVVLARFISVDRAVPTDLRKLTERIPALGTENVAVVELNTRDAMLAAADYIKLRWPSVQTLYLDTKEPVPEPAVIVSKSARLPPPIPLPDVDNRLPPMQAGTRIDPRFWEAVGNNSNNNYNNGCAYSPKQQWPNLNSQHEFPTLQTSQQNESSSKHPHYRMPHLPRNQYVIQKTTVQRKAARRGQTSCNSTVQCN